MLRTNRGNVLKNFILFGLIMIMLLTAWLASAPKMAHAQTEPLQISVQAGLDGQVKPFAWYPVKFTITNPGADLSGELAVFVAGSTDKDTTFSAKVDLPSQTTKEVTIALPGELLHTNNNVVEFYEQSIAKGSKVPIAGGPLVLQTDSVSDTTVQIAVVARDPDTLNFMTFLNQRGYQVRNFALPTDDIPTEAMLLDGLDVLVLNDVDSGLWTQEQINTISDWVTSGGTLVLAGGASYPKTAEPFSELSPVQYNGTQSVTDLTALQQFSERELVIGQPFTLSAAEMGTGSVVLTEQDIPLFAEVDRGLGRVLYAAYDLSLQPLATWGGNVDLWEMLLFDELSLSLTYNQGNRGYGWELNQALEYFASMAPPSVGVLLLVLFIYAILIGPLLYFIFKKMDRREWLWVAIPLVAVISSAAIYGVGASGRGSVMTQSFHTVQLDGQGSGYQKSMAAVFVPSGGNFEVKLPGSYYAAQISDHYGSFSDLRGNADLTIENNPDASTLRFDSVPYWSVRKMQYETRAQKQTGAWEYTLDSSTMSGQLTNKLESGLDQVHVYYNGMVVSLGQVAQDETVDFQLSQASASSYNNYWDIAQMMFPYQGDRDENRQKRALLQDYLTNPKYRFNSADIYVFGFSTATAPSEYMIDGKSVESEDVFLWVQPLEIDYFTGGQVNLPAGTITPHPDFGNTPVHHKDGNSYDLGQGEIILSYRLPRETGVEYERLENFQAYTDVTVEYEIWNEADQTFEQIDSGASVDPLSNYLTDQNTVMIRMTLSDNSFVRFPDFAVKGTVSP